MRCICTVAHRRAVNVVFAAGLLACGDDIADPIPVAMLRLQTDAVEIEYGDSARIVVTVLDRDGRELTDRAVAWASGDANVATVSTTGVIVGVSAGTTTITATAEGVSASVNVTVHAWNIADNVVVIDSTRLSLISDSAERAAGRLRFDVLQGSAPAMPAGTIVVGTQAGGFLRRVTTSTTAGTALTLETAPASLSEVIEEGSFATTIAMLSAPGVPNAQLAARARMQPGGVIWGEGEFTYLAPGFARRAGGFDISGADICQLLAAATIGGTGCPSIVKKFRISRGTLDFEPDVQATSSWSGFSLESFSLIGEGRLDLDLGLEFELGSSLAEFKPSPPVKFFSFTRPFYWQVGPVPVVGYAQLEGHGTLSLMASAKAAMQASVQASSTIRIGAQWQQGWSGIGEYSGNVNPQAPSVEKGTLTGTITAEAKVALKPRLQFIFYGVIGPYAEVEPYGKVTLSLGTQSCSLSATTAVNAAVGFTIPFLDSKVSDFSTSWPNLFTGPGATWTCPLGNIQVNTVTNGTDVDPDGYTLMLDGQSKGSIGASGSKLLSLVELGSHQLTLDGVASNCAVSGGAARSLNIPGPGSTTTVDFIIQCQARAGEIRVSTTTTGQYPDTDGYTVTLDGTTSQAIGSNATASFTGVAQGAHTVTLSDIAPNCTAAGNPRSLNIAAGDTVAVAFAVTCSAGQLTVRANVSGPAGAAANWSVTLDGSQTQLITPNGQVTFTVSPGTHFVELKDMPGHCQVTGANPASVTVTGTSAAQHVFSVMCEGASLTVNVTTTGDPSPVQSYTAVAVGYTSTSINVNGTATLSDLPAGPVAVRLDGVPAHCTVQGLNPQSVSAPGTVSFVVICQGLAQCPAPPPPPDLPFVRDTAYIGLGGTGGSDTPLVITSTYGDLSTSATSTGPAVGGSGGSLAEAQWTDYLLFLPIDSARTGEVADVRMQVTGSLTVTLGGPNTSGGALAELTPMSESLYNTGTKTIDTVITRSVGLGQWYVFRSLARSSTNANYGQTATTAASIKLSQILGVYDFQGNVVPIRQVCTASGTVYPGT